VGATFSCPECKRVYAFKPELAGKSVKCKCGHPFRIPDLSVAREEPGQCPNCKWPMTSSAILCTHCGFNRKTGGVMHGASAGTDDSSTSAKLPVSSRRSSKWVLYGAMAAGVLLIAGLFVVLLPKFGKSKGTASGQPVAATPLNDQAGDGTIRSTASVAPSDARGTQSSAAQPPTNPNEPRVLAGPPEGTTCVALSADGKLLATGGGDKSVRLWNPTTGEQLRRMEHQGVLLDVDISSDGMKVVSVAQDHTVAVWDTTTGEPVKKYVHKSDVSRVRFVGKAQVLIAAGPDILLWNVQTDKPDRTISTGSEVSCLDVSPDGASFVIGQSKVGMVQVWDLTKGEKVVQYRHHTSRWDPQTLPENVRARYMSVDSVAFMDNEHVLVGSGAVGSYIWHWNGNDSPNELEYNIANLSQWATIGPLVVASTASGSLSIIDTSLEPMHIGALPSRDGRMVEMRLQRTDCQAMAAGGGYIALGGGGAWQKDGTWKANQQSKLQIVPVSRLQDAIAADRKGLEKYLQDVKDRLTKATEAYANGTATPAQQQQVSENKLKEAGKPIAVIDGQKAGIVRMAFSPAGKLLATAGGDHTVRLYDFAARKEVKIFEGHADVVTDVAFSTDGKMLLSTGWDHSLIVWNITTGAMEHRIVGQTFFLRGAFLPDGKRVVTTALGMQLWDLQTEKQIGQAGDAETHALSVSHSGVIAIGDYAGNVTVYDTKTNKVVAGRHFGGPASWVYSTYFSDDDTLWMRHTDGTASKWIWASDQTTPIRVPCDGGLTKDTQWAASTDCVVGQTANGDAMIIPTAGGTGGIFDPANNYLVYATGGTLSDRGFESAGPGQIQIYDFNKIKEAIELRKTVTNRGSTAGN
jgi:WD40 repeat protein